MTDTFKVGEVAIYVRPGSPHYGEEVTVTSGLKWREGGIDEMTGGEQIPGLRYDIDFPSGPSGCCAARPEWLRKKQQKRDIDQLVSWDSCLWQPKRQTA